MGCAVHIFDGHFVATALYGHVALYVLNTGGTASDIDRDIAGMLADVDFTALVIDRSIARDAGYRDIAPTVRDVELDVARYVDIHVGSYALVACALCVGIQGERFAVDRDIGLGFFVIAVGFFLLLGANLLAGRDLQHVTIFGHVDVDGAALVVDMQRSARRKLFAEFIAVIEGGPAHPVFNILVVAELDVVLDVGPHTDKLSRRQASENEEQRQNNASGADAARRQSGSLRLFVLD